MNVQRDSSTGDFYITHHPKGSVPGTAMLQRMTGSKFGLAGVKDSSGMRRSITPSEPGITASV
jgi:hypothetical protein